MNINSTLSVPDATWYLIEYIAASTGQSTDDIVSKLVIDGMAILDEDVATLFRKSRFGGIPKSDVRRQELQGNNFVDVEHTGDLGNCGCSVCVKQRAQEEKRKLYQARNVVAGLGGESASD